MALPGEIPRNVVEQVHRVYTDTFKTYWNRANDEQYSAISWDQPQQRYMHRDALIAARKQAAGLLPYKCRETIESATVTVSHGDLNLPGREPGNAVPQDLPNHVSELLRNDLGPTERSYLADLIVRFLRNMYKDIDLQTMLGRVYSQTLPHEQKYAVTTLTQRLANGGVAAAEARLDGGPDGLPLVTSDGSDGGKRTHQASVSPLFTRRRTTFSLAEIICSLSYQTLVEEFDT